MTGQVLSARNLQSLLMRRALNTNQAESKKKTVYFAFCIETDVDSEELREWWLKFLKKNYRYQIIAHWIKMAGLKAVS